MEAGGGGLYQLPLLSCAQRILLAVLAIYIFTSLTSVLFFSLSSFFLIFFLPLSFRSSTLEIGVGRDQKGGGRKRKKNTKNSYQSTTEPILLLHRIRRKATKPRYANAELHELGRSKWCADGNPTFTQLPSVSAPCGRETWRRKAPHYLPLSISMSKLFSQVEATHEHPLKKGIRGNLITILFLFLFLYFLYFPHTIANAACPPACQQAQIQRL